MTLTKYREPDEKPSTVDQMIAKSMVGRIERGALQVLRSAIDKVLRRKMNPYERCGAYVLHSINVLIQNGESTSEIFERHENIVEMIADIKRENLKRLDVEQRKHRVLGGKE